MALYFSRVSTQSTLRSQNPGSFMIARRRPASARLVSRAANIPEATARSSAARRRMAWVLNERTAEDSDPSEEIRCRRVVDGSGRTNRASIRSRRTLNTARAPEAILPRTSSAASAPVTSRSNVRRRNRAPKRGSYPCTASQSSTVSSISRPIPVRLKPMRCFNDSSSRAAILRTSARERGRKWRT